MQADFHLSRTACRNFWVFSFQKTRVAKGKETWTQVSVKLLQWLSWRLRLGTDFDFGFGLCSHFPLDQSSFLKKLSQMFGIFNKTNLSSFERFFVFDASFSHLYPDLIELSNKPFCLLYSHQKIWQTLTQAMARCQNVHKERRHTAHLGIGLFQNGPQMTQDCCICIKEAPLLASWPPGGVGVPLLECSLVALGFAKIA